MEGTAKDVAQASTRMSMFAAPAKTFGNIGDVAFFMGKFADDGNELALLIAKGRRLCERRRKMKKDFYVTVNPKKYFPTNLTSISKGNEFADGLGFWAAESAARNFSNEIDRFEYPVNVVEGSAAQMRPYNCKTLASILRREVIQKIMSNYTKPEDIIYLERDQITAEKQAEFDKCFTKDKKSSKFWGNYSLRRHKRC